MDLHLVGKTTLVSGASMGIGRAIAKGLAAKGAQISAVARRAALLEELAGEIERGQGPRPFCAMLRLPSSVMSIFWSIAPGAAAPLPVMLRRRAGKRRSRSTSPGSARSPVPCVHR